METILHYRYVESDVLVGEWQVGTSDSVEAQLIPFVGKEFPLWPPTEGWGRVIAVEETSRAETDGADNTRFFTIKIERV
nr:hypothetical protein [uncultured bacterium]